MGELFGRNAEGHGDSLARACDIAHDLRALGADIAEMQRLRGAFETGGEISERHRLVDDFSLAGGQRFLDETAQTVAVEIDGRARLLDDAHSFLPGASSKFRASLSHAPGLAEKAARRHAGAVAPAP